MRRLIDVEEHRPPTRGLCSLGIEEAAIIGAVAAAAGAAMSAAGTIVAGHQQAEAARQQAEFADQEAQQAQIAGAAAEETTREKGQRMLAAQRAIIGGSGVTSEGTPLMTLMDTAASAELDALRARYTGEVQAYGSEAQAALLRKRAGQYGTAAAIGAGSTLLTGAGRIANAYKYGKVANDPYNTGSYGAGVFPQP